MHDELLHLLRDKSKNHLRQKNQLKTKVSEQKYPSLKLQHTKNSIQRKSKIDIQLLNNTSILDAENSKLTNKYANTKGKVTTFY